MPDRIYRWEDDFSADPATHPEYVNQGAHMIYNGTLDQIDLSFPNANFDERLILGESFSPIGIVEVDYNVPDPGTAASINFGLAAFGWQVTFGRVGAAGTNIMVFKEGRQIAGDPNFADYHVTASNDLWGGPHTMRLISLPDKVIVQIDDINLLEFPVNKTASIDCQFIWLTYGGTYSGAYINRFKVSTDPSLPLAPIILEPSNGTTLQTRLGPIITQTQANGSPLYVDLTEWAGLITGLTNVTWDPNGLKTGPVNMTETVNQAVSNEDFFFVYRGNGGNTYRLVISEDFVTANNVQPGDTIEFDVVGVNGATDQERLVEIDDDNHLIVEIDESSSFIPDPAVISNYATEIVIHNVNADNNNTHILNGPRGRLFNQNTDDGTIDLQFDSTVNYPILFDLDLGAVRTIKGLAWATQQPNLSVYVGSMDIYAKDTPFTTALLTEGTLVANGYSNLVLSISGSFATALAAMNAREFPPISVTTRYLRLAINADDIVGTPGNIFLGREIFIKEQTYQRFDTANSYGMFQLSQNGSAYIGFPGTGIALTNQSLIKLDLVDELKVDQSYFIRSRLQTDLSD